MKQKIIGISGKKQAGKTTLCDYLHEKYDRYTDLMCAPPFVSVFSFADALKEKICIDVLGLTKDQVYGTDEDKNSLTCYEWENLPYFIRKAYSKKTIDIPTSVIDSGGFQYEPYMEPRIGQMTAREIMQIAGTDIFRNMFSQDIWVNATMRVIKESNVPVALISDCRFPSEVNAILSQDGIVIRLTRQFDEDDTHLSETALDNYPFANTEECFLIDNHNQSIEWKNDQVESLLTRSKIIFTLVDDR